MALAAQHSRARLNAEKPGPPDVRSMSSEDAGQRGRADRFGDRIGERIDRETAAVAAAGQQSVRSKARCECSVIVWCNAVCVLCALGAVLSAVSIILTLISFLLFDLGTEAVEEGCGVAPAGTSCGLMAAAPEASPPVAGSCTCTASSGTCTSDACTFVPAQDVVGSSTLPLPGLWRSLLTVTQLFFFLILPLFILRFKVRLGEGTAANLYRHWKISCIPPAVGIVVQFLGMNIGAAARVVRFFNLLMPIVCLLRIMNLIS